MALQEVLTEEDLIFYEILRHPVLSWEFLQNIDRLEFEEEFEYTEYQKEFCCDFNPYVSLTCGRSVGKTESLTGLIIWLLINNVFPGDYILYTVPNKVHLEPVWARITRFLRTNTILKYFIFSQKGINSSTFTITLLNGSILICRIAGTAGDGRNVIGLHTPFEMLDEGGYYPWPTWLELNPTLNTFTPGARRIVSGVPTGFRENNVLYHVDMQNDSYTQHRISAHENPRYSEDDERRSLELYESIDSENYIHLILGRHGKPTFAVFDRSLMDIQPYPVYKLKLNGIELSDNLSLYIERLSILPRIEQKTHTVVMGVDLGYTDPSAIIIMHVNKHGQFKFHAKIQLNKVPYPIQAKIIDFLDTKFKPGLVGIDEGHAGIAEIQKLKLEPRYAYKNYKERLIPIRFNANVIIGYDEDGKEIKQKTRPYSISVLQEYSNEGKIIYSSTDLELISELERMVYIKLPSGNRVYRTMTPKGGKKGDDHFSSALLCIAMSWYLEHETLSKLPKKQLAMIAIWNTEN